LRDPVNFEQLGSFALSQVQFLDLIFAKTQLGVNLTEILLSQSPPFNETDEGPFQRELHAVQSTSVT